MKNDKLGDRMKRYEMEEAGRRLMPNLPIMARLDGRAFHSFTAGMERPFSRKFSNCMVETAAALVEVFHADLAYTQSDEISLMWRNDDPFREMPFDGRFQKWTSLLSAEASVAFYQAMLKHIPEKADGRRGRPTLDCRVWQLPNMVEVYNTFVWREDDATRNSLQMAAQAHYSHHELHGVASPGLHDLLYSKGINWDEYPAFFKRGTYLARRPYQRYLTDEELSRIPEEKRPVGPILRTGTFVLDAAPIRQYKSIEPFIEPGLNNSVEPRHIVGEELQ